MRKRLITAATIAALCGPLLLIGGDARAGGEPTITSVIESYNSTTDRAVVWLMGKKVSKITGARVLDDGGADVGSGEVVFKSGKLIALQLPAGLNPGPYELKLTHKKGEVSQAVTVGFSAIAPGAIMQEALDTAFASQLTDALTLEGNPGSFFRDASNLNAGTLPTSRFSAHDDLLAESKIGTATDQVSAGDHDHTGAYVTPAEIGTADSAADEPTDPIHFTKIRGLPSGLADGDADTTYTAGTNVDLTGTEFSVPDFPFSDLTGLPFGLDDGDDDTTYNAGINLALTGTTFSVPTFPWTSITGVPPEIADGDKDTTYNAGANVDLNGSTFSVPDFPFSSLTGVPAGLDNGDDDTTYSAGTGLSLNAGVFSVTSFPWTSLTGIPAGFADGLDADTLYTAGAGLTVSSDEFSVIFDANGSADMASRSDHGHTAPAWTDLTGIPADFADGTDADTDTKYDAGAGLLLNEGLTPHRFSVDFGTGIGDVATGNHNHDNTYTKSIDLKTKDNQGPNSPLGGLVHWTQLTNVPPNVENNTLYDTAGATSGLTLDTSAGTSGPHLFAADFGITAGKVAEGNHDHDVSGSSTIGSGTYVTAFDLKTGDGDPTDNNGFVHLDNILGLSAGFDSVYTAGTGLTLTSGTTERFSVNFGPTATEVAPGNHHHDATTINGGSGRYVTANDLKTDDGNGPNDILGKRLVSWTVLRDVPPEFADGFDKDTEYTAGTGLSLSGAKQFSVRDDYVKNSGDSMTGALSVSTSSSGTPSIKGTNSGSTGTGVHGKATGSGDNAGGFFETSSGLGSAVKADATAGSGLSYGVFATNDSSSGVAVNALATSSGGTALIAEVKGISTSGNIAQFLHLGSARFTFARNGDLTVKQDITCKSLTETSDARLKTEIEPLGEVVEKLSGIQSVTYRFKDQTSNPHLRHMGVIAQEVQAVFPELVREDENGMLSVAYGNFTAVLLQGIKEQQKQIEEQREALESRDTEIDTLRTRLAQMDERMARIERALTSPQSEGPAAPTGDTK